MLYNPAVLNHFEARLFVNYSDRSLEIYRFEIIVANILLL